MNLRLLALAGVAVCAVALPLAVASAGQVGEESGRVTAPASPAPTSSVPADAKASSPSPLNLGLGLATAARCGPELTSPEGIEAQTCVLTQGEETWARTYYRNTTGGALDSVLSLMGPAGRTVQMRCAVGAEDEPGTCETPRERTRGDLDGYTAVAEFASHAGQGPLLLRSGSNSGASTGG
ncbi:hypothetical protein BN159_4624 [Streptomyces davaonensis JCM 4913]|uniref:Secreted protein n=1 Tax=Streptomyces davaonensis (strain DSM 101723 / JCM 4913 / KCC S-0913 / 768) TaxID=1214101 RepID=K4R6L8_STRDJ|nr:hypothetical protein [Streptomyces davaonensis]CCK29003.1 hypothetical protein BN159_4624 [Streptomyces davaonensis JCM 4913]